MLHKSVLYKLVLYISLEMRAQPAASRSSSPVSATTSPATPASASSTSVEKATNSSSFIPDLAIIEGSGELLTSCKQLKLIAADDM